MDPTGRLRAWFITGAAVAALAGCEEHRQSAIHDAPEYLHEALAGDASAQLAVASCFGGQEGCIGYVKDPAMACAWRGVRLAARSPDLSLSDQDAYLAACANEDLTGRQRASIAQEDYTWRIYHRHAPQASGAQDRAARLYPSVETVRQRVNAVLGAAHAAVLPRFNPPRPASDDLGPITWMSCGGAVCLEALAPAFGGGLLSYRITVSPAPTATKPSLLAPQLAAAGLDAPGIGEQLQRAASQPGVHRIQAGGVCWSEDAATNGGYATSAAPTACENR